MSGLPPLPDGFQLEATAPAPPEGFVIEGAEPSPKKPFSLLGALAKTWPAQAVKNAYEAVTLPGDVYAGKARVPSSGAVPGSVEFGSPESSGLRIADLAMLASPMAPRSGLADSAIPTQGMLKAKTNSQYNAVADAGVVLHPEAAAGVGNGIKNVLERDFRLNAERAPETFALLDKLRKNPPTKAGFDTVTDLESLITVRETLGDIGGILTKPRDKFAADKAIRLLDKYLEDIPQSHIIRGDAPQASGALQEATGNYSALKHSQTVTKAERKAERQAASTGAGGNIDNATRQQFKSIANSEKKSRGFKPDELAQIDRIAEGTRTGNAMRYLGKLAPTGNVSAVLSGTAGAGIGGAVGSLLGSPGIGAAVGAGALPAAGALAKALGDASTRRQVTKLNNMVLSRSPMAEQLRKSQSINDRPIDTALMRALLLSHPETGIGGIAKALRGN